MSNTDPRWNNTSLCAVLFDLVVFFLIGIYLNGGISYCGKVYLSHGADPRRAALILAVFVYGAFPMLREKSSFFRMAISFSHLLTFRRFRQGFYLIGVVFGVALAIEQTLALRVTLYDVGIFHQILWSLSHGLGFHSTISGAGNFLQDHFSPSLALLVPGFQLALKTPFYLPIVHTLLLFLGGAAWIFLADRVPGVAPDFRKKLSAATTVFVLCFGSLWGNLRWGFHENALAFSSLSWAFALLFADCGEAILLRGFNRKTIVFGLFLIAAASKEILLLDVALFLCCWAMTLFRYEVNSQAVNRRHGLKPIVLGVLAAFLVGFFIYFENSAHPVDKNYFNRYYAYLGQDLKGFVRTLSHSPGVVIQAVGAKELAKYFLTVFSPWLFLPLWPLWLFPRFHNQLREQGDSLPASKIWMIGLLPSFASAALATYPPLRNENFHYVLELWPLLACLTIILLGQIRSDRLIWIWVFFIFLKMDQNPLGDLRDFRKESKDVAPVRALLQKISPDSKLVADELAGPWVSGRLSVTRWPETSWLPAQCPDFIVTRYPEGNLEVPSQIQSLILRCQINHAQREKFINKEIPTPFWRIGVWSGYRLSDNSFL